MKHLIAYTVIIAFVCIYMIYKCFEYLINITIPQETEEPMYYQLDMFRMKRLILNKIKI